MSDINIIPIQKKYKNQFVKTFGKRYFNSENKAKQHFKEYLRSERLFLLFINHELAGFFNYYHQYSHYANYLEDICIGEKFKGQNYSKYLLSKYIEISKQQKTQNKIALSSTRKTNIHSQKMHKNFGFKKIGTLKELHYGEDEIFYAFSLK